MPLMTSQHSFRPRSRKPRDRRRAKQDQNNHKLAPQKRSLRTPSFKIPSFKIQSVSPVLGFRLRYRYRWPVALAFALLAALALQVSLRPPRSEQTAALASSLETRSAEVVSNEAPEPRAETVPPSVRLTSNERVILIENPNGLDLAHKGRRVEVVAISGLAGPISATPITYSAFVIDRSDSSASLVVTEAEALQILEAQALGSIALLALD